jgi:IS5 family transposase
MRQGTIVDATLIATPNSTKNSTGERDPEMHQTKKGNQWHFGMKAHVGADADSGLVHTVVGTAANVNDVTQAHLLLHGEETDVLGDAGYQGVDKREENRDKQVSWHIAMRPGKRRALPDTPWGAAMQKIEQAKARIRAKVEHAFHVVKNLCRIGWAIVQRFLSPAGRRCGGAATWAHKSRGKGRRPAPTATGLRRGRRDRPPARTGGPAPGSRRPPT